MRVIFYHYDLEFHVRIIILILIELKIDAQDSFHLLLTHLPRSISCLLNSHSIGGLNLQISPAIRGSAIASNYLGRTWVYSNIIVGIF